MLRKVGSLKLFIRSLYWVFLSIGLFIVFPTNAKEFSYRTKEISPFHNTFNKEINCVTSDDKGYLWFGTYFGLFRYDGYNTDEIDFLGNKNTGQKPAIYRNLYHDKVLYIATRDGLFTIDLSNNEFTAAKIDLKKDIPILDIIADTDGKVWWIDGEGDLFCKKGKKITKTPLNIALNRISSIAYHNNTIWISKGDATLIGVNAQTSQIVYNYVFNQIKKINSISITGNQELILCTEKGLIQLQHKKQQNKHSFNLWKAYGDSIRYALFTNNQVFITKMNLNVIHTYATQDQHRNTLVISASRNFQVESKAIWYNNQLLIPNKNGLTVVEPMGSNIKPIHLISNDIDGDSRGITEDEKYYYLFAYMNITRIDKQTKKAENISKHPYICHGVLRDGNFIWIASETLGLIKFNTQKKQFDEVFKDRTDISHNLVCLFPMNEDSLMIGASKALLVYNKKTNQVSSFKPLNKQNKLFTNGFVRQIDTLKKDIYLVATSNGLYKINKQGKIILEFGKKNDSSIYLNTNCFWINKRKEIWTGTTNGIIVFDSTGRKINQINTADGLAGNKIASITADKDDNLWVATFSGLSKINTSDLSISNYYRQQGLPDNEFNHSSNYLTDDGKILLGTLQGFIEIDPALHLETKYKPSSIHISKIDFSQNNIIKQYKVNDWDFVKTLKVGKDINYIRLYLNRLPIQFNNEISFTYKIHNLFEDRVDITNNPIVTLMDSEDGKYDVDVLANDLQGSNGINQLIIPYRVIHYFYTNKWFYVMVILLILFLLIAYLYSLIVQNKRMLELRTAISRDLHDEIGGSMTALLMYTELLRTDKAPSQKQIDNLQLTARKIMTSFKDALWSINTGSDSALQFWDHFKDAASNITSPFNIYIHYEEPSDLNQITFTVSIKRNLLLALKEALNNAIKYGDKESIYIKWEILDHKHCISIVNSLSENATFDISRMNQGIGLNSMKKRLTDIGGELYYEVVNQEFHITFHLNFIK